MTRSSPVYQPSRPLHLIIPGHEHTLCGIKLRLSEAHPYCAVAYRDSYTKIGFEPCTSCQERAPQYEHIPDD